MQGTKKNIQPSKRGTSSSQMFEIGWYVEIHHQLDHQVQALTYKVGPVTTFNPKNPDPSLE